MCYCCALCCCPDGWEHLRTVRSFTQRLHSYLWTFGFEFQTQSFSRPTLWKKSLNNLNNTSCFFASPEILYLSVQIQSQTTLSPLRGLPSGSLISPHYGILPERYFTPRWSFSFSSLIYLMTIYMIGKHDQKERHLSLQCIWVTNTGVPPSADQAQRTLSVFFISPLILLNIFTHQSSLTLAAVLLAADGFLPWLCFPVTFWLSELWLKSNHVSICYFFSSPECFSVWSSLCGWIKKNKKKISRSAMLSMTCNSQL